MMTNQLQLDLDIKSIHTAGYVPLRRDTTFTKLILESTNTAKQKRFYCYGSTSSGKSSLLYYLCSVASDANQIAAFIDFSKLHSSTYYESILNEINDVDLLCVDNIDESRIDDRQAELLIQLFGQLASSTLVLSASNPPDTIENTQIRDYILGYSDTYHLVGNLSTSELESVLNNWINQSGRIIKAVRTREFCNLAPSNIGEFKQYWQEFCRFDKKANDTISKGNIDFSSKYIRDFFNRI